MQKWPMQNLGDLAKRSQIGEGPYFVLFRCNWIVERKILTDSENLTSHTVQYTGVEIEEHWGVAKVMRLMREKGGETSPIPPNCENTPGKNKPTESGNLASRGNKRVGGFCNRLQRKLTISRIQPDREDDFPSWEEVEQILPEVFNH